MERAPIRAYDWSHFKPTERAVIVFVRRDDQVLLIHKKRGLGGGKVNGPGGRLEDGETSAVAAAREVDEEVGLQVSSLLRRGELDFAFTNGYNLSVDVFLTDSYSGTPTETDEADPFWCGIEEIPYDRMWADDRLWLPRVLSGEFVKGRFYFDDDVMLESHLDV